MQMYVQSPTGNRNSTIESTNGVSKMILDSVLGGNSFIDENFQIIAPFLDTIQGCYLHQHVFQPTRYRDGDDPGILDLVLSNEEGMVFILTNHSKS